MRIVIVLFVIFTNTGFSRGQCPTGWEFRDEMCYYFSDESNALTWTEAESFCRQNEGHLVSFLSTGERDWVVNFHYQLGSKPQRYWIGLTDHEREDTFAWVDGNPLSADVANWKINEPSNSNGEHCVEVWIESRLANPYNQKWNDVSCEVTHPFTCKRQQGDVEQCPGGWILLGGRCYLVMSSMVTEWFDAFDECKRRNSDLVSISSRDEEVNVENLVAGKGQNFWIGLSDTASAGSFSWSDKVTPYSYTNWAKDQPPNPLNYKGSTCVEMNSALGYMWETAKCSDERAFVCERGLKAQCPNQWLYSGEKCYEFIVNENRVATWTEANRNCQVIGAGLLKIESDEQQNFVSAALQAYQFANQREIWLGASDIGHDDSLLWWDKTTIQRSYWDYNMPRLTPGRDDCANLYTGKGNNNWEVTGCFLQLGYICEIQEGKQLASIPVVTVEGKCEDGWRHYSGKCYLFASAEVSKSTASNACGNKGAQLTSIQDEDEQSFLVGHLQQRSWIGLTIAGNNNYNWEDGSPVTFQNWLLNQPDGDGSCVTMDSGGNWEDVDCGQLRTYVCEKNEIPTDTVTLAPPSYEPDQEKCGGDGWISDPQSDRCYKINLQLRSWNDARYLCQVDGGDLASINTPNEQVFVESLGKAVINEIRLWLGGNDKSGSVVVGPGMEMVRQFTIQLPTLGFRYEMQTFECLGEPNNENNEDCLHMYLSDGYWNDVPCQTYLGGICEKQGNMDNVVGVEPSDPFCRSNEACCFKHIGAEYRGSLPDSSFSASTEKDMWFNATRGRLNTPADVIIFDIENQIYIGTGHGAWEPTDSDPDPWLQVDLPTHYEIKAIITQGRNGILQHEEMQWTTTYKVSYSQDKSKNSKWEFISDQDGNVIVFDGNKDQNTMVTNFFPRPIVARHLRCHPMDYRGRRALRVEYIGCRASCLYKIGMNSGYVSDDKITASSERVGHEAKQARPPVDNSQCLSSSGDRGTDYRGWISKTASGLNCQLWSAQSPHSHTETPQNYPQAGLVGDYCRNPDNRQEGPWCYTMDSDKKWEPCDIPTCPTYTPSGWQSTSTSMNEYVQVQFDQYYKVGGVTLYRGGSAGYVTEYALLFSENGYNFRDYKDAQGNSHRFTGLDGQVSEYMDILREPVSARYVRIRPLSWQGTYSLFFELNGCYVDRRLSCSELGSTFLAEDTFTVDCPPGCLEDSVMDPVYGTDIYTTNSAICPSAIHAGKANDRIGGTVSVTIREGKGSYAGSYRNGITSQSYGAYPSSFSFTGNTMRCDDGWRTWNEFCYYFSPKGVETSWQEARAACLGMQADLVSIGSQGENDFVESMLIQMDRGDDAWIGMTDLETPNYFLWVDGTPVVFTKWFFENPNNANDRCVQMYRADGYWNDKECYFPEPYICKRLKRFLPPLTTIFPPTDAGCDAGWFAYGSSCYRVSNDEYNQIYAELHCQDINSRLVSIHDDYEQAFVHSLVTSTLPQFAGYTAWIGLAARTDEAGGQYFTWTSSEEPVSYSHWDKGEPDARLQCSFPFVYQGVTYYDCTTVDNPLVLQDQQWCSIDPEYNGRYIYCGNDNPQGCTYMSSQTGFWNLELCLYQRYYVCEKDRVGFTQPIVTTPSTNGNCPAGWHGSDKTSSCYQINDKVNRTERLSWQDALDNCRAQGADLVSLHSSTEETYVMDFVYDNGVYSYTSFWLGLNNLDADVGYQWSDGTPLTYTNWNFGEPSDHNGEENCVESQLMYSATWNDLNCDSLRNWVCKIKKGVTPLPPPTLPTPEGSVSTLCGTDVTWIAYTPPDNVEKCYFFAEERMHGWANAEKNCTGYGGHLVSIHSLEEKSFLLSRIARSNTDAFWIGLRDVAERQFMWTDDSMLDYVNWGPGEPNDYFEAEGCAEMYTHDGLWNDDNCGLQQAYICQKYKGDPPASIPPTPIPTGYCPQGFMPYGNKCWMVSGYLGEERLSWYMAQERCQNNSASLAVIQNQYEQAFVNTLLFSLGRNAWIGMRSFAYGPFLWADESAITYTNWGDGEPNYGGDTCVRMTYSGSVGKWNDGDCEASTAFICYTPISMSNPEPAATSAPDDCPAGYRLYGDACFKLMDQPQSWDNARQACQDEGKGIDLVSISQSYENSLIKSWFWRDITSGSSVWIGLQFKTTTSTPETPIVGATGTPILTETTFTWIDGWPVYYTNWGTGEPDTDVTANPSGCTFMDSDGYWRVATQAGTTSCATAMPFVCRKSLVPAPTTPDPGEGTCDPGFEGYGQYCYYIELGIYTVNTRSWWEARYECESKGAKLASIHNEAEGIAIIDMITLSSHNLWIGLNHDGFDGWKWDDGTPTDFFNWVPGEPNGVGRGEVCVEMYPWNSQWNDVDCLQGRGYVCKLHKSNAFCGVVPIELREDCGYSGIDEPMCRRRGCCWDRLVINANFSGCFYPANFEFPSTEPIPDGGLSGGAIAGIVIGVLLLVAVIAGSAYYLISVRNAPSGGGISFTGFGGKTKTAAPAPSVGFDNPVTTLPQEGDTTA